MPAMIRCFATANEGELRQLISVLPGVSFRYRTMAENKGSFIDIDGNTISLFGLRQDSILKDSRTLWFQCSKEDRRKVAESMGSARQSLQPWQAQWNIQLGGGCARRIQGQAVVTEEHDDGGLTWSGIFSVSPKGTSLQLTFCNPGDIECPSRFCLSLPLCTRWSELLRLCQPGGQGCIWLHGPKTHV